MVLLHAVVLSDRYPHVPVDPDDLPIRPGLKPPYPYKTVGCVFNHEYFYANSQVFIAALFAEEHLPSLHLCNLKLS